MDYISLLSGKPVWIDGVGWMRSPKIKEICGEFDGGISYGKYATYLSILQLNKKTLSAYMEKIGLGSLIESIKEQTIPLFRVLMLMNDIRALLVETIRFFVIGDVSIEMEGEYPRRLKITYQDKQTGLIDESNFDMVRHTLMTLNHLSAEVVERQKKQTKSKDGRTQKFFERAAKYEQQNKKNKEVDKFDLGNIVSKLCVYGSSYNLLTIYELTVFQLYDQFIQMCTMKGNNISEKIYCTWGGDSFKLDNWLIPIQNNT